MDSRERILTAIRNNQPGFTAAPPIDWNRSRQVDLLARFMEVLRDIGGRAEAVENEDRAIQRIQATFGALSRIVSNPHTFGEADPHTFHDVDVFITSSRLAVAENGAVWINDTDTPQRVLPFITQHLAVVIREKDIVATMHDAYAYIADSDYGFATFIAGPSKTADIEQSLVLGAHGPKTMTVYILLS